MRAKPNLHFEKALWKKGVQHIGGVDEAGRGAWAGPVSAAVVILPDDPRVIRALSGVRDSKQMTPRQRLIWCGEIQSAALDWGVGFTNSDEIDNIGIVPATRLAVMRALETINVMPQHLLIDYLKLPESNLPQTPIIKGDAKCLSIAAASVLAKVSRDSLMFAFDGQYDGYRFSNNKGYGTAQHQLAIRKNGLSAIHRKSFRFGR